MQVRHGCLVVLMINWPQVKFCFEGAKGIDFEMFREVLTDKLQVGPKGKGGRKPYDYVLMFKVMALQRYYNISDDQTEYQICDRLCFMRFLKLTIADDVPDSKTIWFFRERLTDIGLVETLFELFIKKLTELNLIIHEGKIVDASFVEVPKQRNTRAENQTIKEGAVPQQLQNNPHKLAQKDVDTKWTKKNNIPYYGYKNHTMCDEKSKLITGYSVTSAAVHDSQPTEALLTPEDEQQPFFADSAYIGGVLNKTLVEDKKVIPQIQNS